MANEVIENQSTPQPRPALSLVGAPRALLPDSYECFIGLSPHVAELKQFLSVQAQQRQPVLLVGERGLRQEQIARVLHQASEHWAQPFFALNAHGLGGDALHRLLFAPRGLIETCRRGTIYINELTSLPLLLQQRFAAYFEEQLWHARSGKATHLRLIFSTEWKPAEIKAENRLAYGLVELLRPSSFVLKPLRERSEDIPHLANHLAGRIAQRLNKGAYRITPAAIRVLTEYAWVKNIDELESVLESVIASTPPQRIDEGLLPNRLRYLTLRAIPEGGIDLPQMVDDYEWSLIEAALRQTGGNQTKAARILRLRVQTLNMKIKRFAESKRTLNAEG